MMAKPLKDILEPGTIDTLYGSKALIQLSIAISLKRIADAMTYRPAGDYNLFDFIQKIANK